MRKFLKVLCLTLLIGLLTISSVSASVNIEEPTNAVNIEITEEEYLSCLAEEHGISIEEARILNDENTMQALSSRGMSMQSLYSGQEGGVSTQGVDTRVYYVARYQVFSLNTDVAVEIGATYKVLDTVGYKEILNCFNEYTRKAAGANIIQWEELGVSADPGGGYPTQNVTLLGTGYFYFTIENGVEVSFDIAGFGVSGSTSTTTTYTSSTMFLQVNINAQSL